MRRTAVLVVLLMIVSACATPEVGARQEMRVPTGDDVVEIAIVDRVNENGVVASAWYVDPYALMGDALYDVDLGFDDRENAVAVHRDRFGYDVVVAFLAPNCFWGPEIRVDDDGDTVRLHLRSFGDCGDRDSMASQRAVGFRFADGVEPDTVLATHETVS